MKKVLLFICCVIGLSFNNKKEYILYSPDKNIQVKITEDKGKIEFLQLYAKDTIICKSPIGFLVDSVNFTQNIFVSGFKESSFDETWETVNGKNKTVRNYYNGCKIFLKNKNENFLDYTLEFRCYNDGFAYRALLKSHTGDSIHIDKELTNLNFKTDFTYWAYNYENPNIGPLKRSESPMSKVQIPVVLELRDNLYMAIHEAEIIRYAPFSLRADGDNTNITFNLEKTRDKSSIKTSWRTFIIGVHSWNLVESNLLVNLNEPCKIEDTSWIKPGKSLWNWRVLGYKAKDSFEYGLNTKSNIRMIDFAAKNNIQYLLIDADWYGPEFSADSDPTLTRESIDIKKCIEFAKGKELV